MLQTTENKLQIQKDEIKCEKKNTLHSDSINVKPFKPGSKTIYFTGVHAPVIDRVC